MQFTRKASPTIYNSSSNKLQTIPKKSTKNDDARLHSGTSFNDLLMPMHKLKWSHGLEESAPDETIRTNTLQHQHDVNTNERKKFHYNTAVVYFIPCTDIGALNRYWYPAQPHHVVRTREVEDRSVKIIYKEWIWPLNLHPSQQFFQGKIKIKTKTSIVAKILQIYFYEYFIKNSNHS